MRSATINGAYFILNLSASANVYGFIIVPFLFFGIKGRAQESIKPFGPTWRVEVGPTLVQQRVIDTRFSSLVYAGSGWGGFFSLNYQNRNSVHSLFFNYSDAELSSDKNTGNGVHESSFSIDYSNLFGIYPNENSSWHLRGGGAVQFLHSNRKFSDFINNNSSFESVASIGGAVEVLYKPRNIPTFSISNYLSLPIVSALRQPVFGDESSAGWELKFWSDFAEIKNRLVFKKSFQHGQAICLAYTWIYYQSLTEREVKKANHQIALLYSINL